MSLQHTPYRWAKKIAGPSTVRRLAWVAWGISMSLLLSATLLWSLDGGNLLQNVDFICTSIAFSFFGTVGALIAWQRPRNTIGWIFCAVGIGTGITDFSAAYAAYGTVQGHLPGTGVINLLGDTVWPLNWVLLIVFLPLLFPDGRPLTPRWRIVGWFAAILALLSLLAGDLGDLPAMNMEVFGKVIPANFWGTLSSVINLFGLPLMLVALLSQILRFIRAKERERQQIKWLTYGCVMMVALIVGSIFIWNDQTNLTFDLAISFLPLSIGISILRNQLYDIDRLISRTLLYLLLSALLVLTYLALVFGLQFVLQGITQNSPVPIVLSTLVVAALFQPLRRAIQRAIDRRFYRRKYDSTKIVTAFSSTLRQEVELDTLRERLLAVVQETMQPTHVSLWLRQPEHGGKHLAPWRANPPISSDGR
jgi:hypothetical protein